jgi:hypothetical protein
MPYPHKKYKSFVNILPLSSPCGLNRYKRGMDDLNGKCASFIVGAIVSIAHPI